MTLLFAYLLSAMGLTIVVVWPSTGPGAWVRDRVLRVMVPDKFESVLDCYICFGFWAGLLLGSVWWLIYEATWAWFGCLMVPALFWLALKSGSGHRAVSSQGGGPP
ncbi:MAG: hypothetical protein AAGC72_05690 [Planctomycetota bacterium]